MKKAIIILVAIFITSCSKDNESKTVFNVSNIAGKWQLVEILAFNPDGPSLVSNGPILNLKLDNTFTYNNSDLNFSGTYSISTDSIISLNYENVVAPTETVFKKVRSLTTTQLILDDDLSDSGYACAEGCAEKYSKVNIE